MKKLFPIILLLCLSLVAPTAAQDNAFHQVLSYGRGVPQSVYWQPDGDKILVNAITGAWLYSGDDLSDIAHFDALHNASFSPDGRWLVGVDDGDKTQIRDANTFELATLPNGFQKPTFSPDGRWLLGTVGEKPVLLDATHFHPVAFPAAYTDTPPSYFIWSPDSHKLAAVSTDNSLSMWKMGDDSPQVHITTTLAGYPQWSPDTRKILRNDPTDNRVQIWDADTGKLSLTLSPQAIPPRYDGPGASYVGKILWSPDSTQILRYYDIFEIVTVEVVDVTTGAFVKEWGASYLDDMWFSPDGKYLAIHHGLVDIHTYESTVNLDPETDFSAFLSWSPNSRFFAITYWSDRKIDIVDAQSGKIIHTLIGHINDYRSQLSAQWSPDNTKLLSWSDKGEFFLWDVNEGKRIAVRDEHINISAHAAFSSDSQFLAAADSVGKVRLWNTKTNTLIKTITDHKDEVETLLWQPGGKLLATRIRFNIDPAVIDDYGMVRIWDAETGNLVHTIVQHQLTEHTIAWSPDGDRLFVGSYVLRGLQIWDAVENKDSFLDVGGGYSPYPTRFSWSPDQEFLAVDFPYATHGSQAIRLFDAHTLSTLVNRVIFSISDWYVWDTEDNRLRLASAGCPPYTASNCTISIITLFNPAEYTTPRINLDGFVSPVDMVLGVYQTLPTVKWNPDGKQLAVTDQQTTWVWEIGDTTKQLLLTLKNTGSVIWSPDGTKLAAQTIDGDAQQLEILDLASGDSLLRDVDVTLNGWSPDSQYIDVRKDYSHSSLWDVQSGQQIAALGGQPVVWSPDGSKFVDLSGGVIRAYARN